MSDVVGVPSLLPVLAVDDVRRAVEFYTRLGFTEVFSIPDQTGDLVHAHIRYRDSALFLGRPDVSHYPDHPRAGAVRGSRPPGRGIGITLILQVDDLSGVFDFVRREHLEVLAEPADEYYGDRVFFFLDPFGYEWKISQPIPAGQSDHP